MMICCCPSKPYLTAYTNCVNDLQSIDCAILRQLLTDGLQPVFRYTGDNNGWQLVKGEIGMLRKPDTCREREGECWPVNVITLPFLSHAE